MYQVILLIEKIKIDFLSDKGQIKFKKIIIFTDNKTASSSELLALSQKELEKCSNYQEAHIW